MLEKLYTKKQGSENCPQTKVLLVENDADIREQLKWALEPECLILEAADRSTALKLFKAEHPIVIALDLGLPPDPDGVSEGLSVLESIMQIDRLAKVIVLTGKGDRATGQKAVALGAYDYLAKPFDLDVLRILIQRAEYLGSLELENESLKEAQKQTSLHDMVGTSAAMRRVFEMITQVAPSEIPVLVTGPSGTGKELVAKALHRQSERKRGPFVAINCGAIPETLLESELFGYERGAFTGAVQRRVGRIESAQSGTLFLDEIGELPPALQVKLLRFLQEREIERLGGRDVIPVDVRVVAATNTDLKQAIAECTFREDLYYRICGITITMPPLRERGEDVEQLTQAFLTRYATELGKRVTGLTREAMQIIRSYHWPGNVRELENVIRRAIILSKGKRLTTEDLGLEGKIVCAVGSSLREVRETAEKEHIKQILARCKGNISKAAIELGISRPTLHGLLVKLQLREGDS
jgi:two-component system NtrC family response regulator